MAHPVEIILMRQWASYMTLPIFICDQRGNLIFYNDRAGEIIGRTFDEAGEMPGRDLARLLVNESVGGKRLFPSNHPLGVALIERRPAYGKVRMRGLDNVWRMLEITAIPIIAQGNRFLGAMACFTEAGPE